MSAFACVALLSSFSAHADWCWDGFADKRPVMGNPGLYSVTCVDVIATCMEHFGPSEEPSYGDEVRLTDGSIMYLMRAEINGINDNGNFSGGAAVVSEHPIAESDF